MHRALLEQAQAALLLSLTLALPIVAAAAVVGVFVAVVQAAFQVQDTTISHLPRLLIIVLAICIAGPWMGAQVTRFALGVFSVAQAIR